jgi:hypothetical protein
MSSLARATKQSLIMREIIPIDLTNSTSLDFEFPSFNDDGDYLPAKPTIKTIRDLTNTPRDVYLICTAYIPNNLKVNRSYIKASHDVTNRAELCAEKHPEISELKFTQFLRILSTFAEWRCHQKHQTIIILLPPPLKHVASWERAFAQVGLITAWVDENGNYEPSQYSLAPSVKSVRRVEVTNTEDFEAVEQMMPSSTMKLWSLVGSSKKATAAIRQKARRLIIKVEEKHKDRRFSLSMPSSNRGYITIRRLGGNEYAEWLRGGSYDDAVARCKGGLTNARERYRLINEPE